MNVIVKLLVLKINLQQSSTQILLDDNNLPEDALLKSHPFEVCKDILTNCLTMDVDWVTFLLVDNDFDGNNLLLYYTCLIPDIIDNTKYKWKSIGDISDEKIQRLAFKASQQAVATRTLRP